ncbi:MAG TPA: hypothetical protein PKH07_14460 [bacterium]|nr:hypothetical protein [bacterium]
MKKRLLRTAFIIFLVVLPIVLQHSVFIGQLMNGDHYIRYQINGVVCGKHDGEPLPETTIRVHPDYRPSLCLATVVSSATGFFSDEGWMGGSPPRLTGLLAREYEWTHHGRRGLWIDLEKADFEEVSKFVHFGSCTYDHPLYGWVWIAEAGRVRLRRAY